MQPAPCPLACSSLQPAAACPPWPLLQVHHASGRGKKLVLQAHSGGRAAAAAGCGLLRVSRRAAGCTLLHTELLLQLSCDRAAARALQLRSQRSTEAEHPVMKHLRQQRTTKRSLLTNDLQSLSDNTFPLRSNPYSMRENLCIRRGNPCPMRGNLHTLRGNPCAMKGNLCTLRGNPCPVRGNLCPLKGQSVPREEESH